MADYAMDRWRTMLRIFMPAALLAAIATLLMASGTPGPQFQVNTFTSGLQRDPAIARDAAGNFVITWSGDFAQDGDGSGIFAQRYDASGQPVGPEFQVNTFTTGFQSNPVVGMDSTGNFIVAWTSDGQDGDGFGVFAQRYDANGQPVGPEFQVNTTTTGNQSMPAVAMGSSGNFVIAWTSGVFGVAQEVLAQRFDSNGVAVGSEFQVNTSAGDIFDRPTVAINTAGNFVIAWTGVDANNQFLNAVLAQRFDATGTPQGIEFQVNTSSGARWPVAGMDQTGNFVVAWQTSNFKIRAQRFDVAGARQGSDFQVNTFSKFGERPALAMNASGNFVIAGLFDDGEDPHIFAQCYNADGTPQGDELQVNDSSPSVSARAPAAAMDGSGNFVIAWTGRDASQDGVFARSYTAVAPSALSLSINDVSVTEGDSGTTDAIFTVTLSAASTETVTVNFATADGTATAGVLGDYQPNSGTLTFAPGETSQEIRVRVNGDTFAEADESFFVNLNSPSNNASIGKGRGIGTILNDDFTISISDANPVIEGNSATVTAAFTVGLSGSSTKTVTVDFATANGTATLADNDYAANSGTLTFNPGQTSKQITVLVNGDTHNEFNETFFVNLSNPANAAISDGQGVGTIRNDDFGSTLAGNQFQVNTTFFGNQFQPALGMNNAGSFVISWTGAVTDATGFITGTGIFARRFDSRGIVQGPDFRVDDPSFVFGTQTKPAVAMDANGDFVVVWNGGNVEAAASDPDAICSICNIYAQRFDANGNKVGPNFQVNASTPGASLRDHPSVGMYASGEFVVAWRAFGAAPPLGSGTGIFAQRFDNNGARLGSEFLVNSFTAANQFNPVVVVNPSECVSSGGTPVACSLAGFVIAWQGASVDDGAGIFARQFDANGVPAAGQFRVNMYTENIQERPAIGMDAHGNFVVAWEGEGLAFPSGPIVRGIFAQRFDPNGTPLGWCNPLPPGPVICTISDLLVNTDTTAVHRPAVGMEKNGNFVIGWDGFHMPTSQNSAIFARSFDSSGIPQGGNEFLVNQTFPLGEFDPDARMDAGGNFVIAWVGGDSSISGVFARHFAAAPTLSISDFSESEGDAGTKNWTFTVTLSTASTQTVTVDFGTADGTATLAGNDYLSNSGTLVFAPGDTSKTITVIVNGDTTPESDETFLVNLGNATNAAIAKSQGVGTILNDDCALSINDVSVTEGNSGTTSAIFTVNLPCPNSQTVTVNIATANGTATAADNDYVVQSGRLTFLPGETSKNITILINGDTTPEPDETFSVNLSNATNASIADGQGVGTITNDDDVQIVVNETITVSDAPGVLPSAMIGVDERITVTDAPAVLPSAMIGVNENINVTDSPDVRVPDNVAPHIQCAVPDGQWHANDVSLACTASDSGSGLANAGDASFVLTTNVSPGVQTTNALTGSRQVCDHAGNCATAGPIGGNMIDKKAPVITITAPTGTYLLGQAAAARYSCGDDGAGRSDSGSGRASCVGPVADGSNFDTATVGVKIFTVEATDNVGNLARASVAYRVTYSIAALYDVTKSKKAGSTVALRLQLTDSSGANRSSSQIAVSAVNLILVSGQSSQELEITSNANPDLDFRFDPVSGAYIFNLSTKGLAPGTYVLFFTVSGDPGQHSIQFQLK